MSKNKKKSKKKNSIKKSKNTEITRQTEEKEDIEIKKSKAVKPVEAKIEEAVVIADKPIILDQDSNVVKEKAKGSSKKSFRKKAKNLVFLSMWTYFFLKVFVTDIDLLVVKELGLTNTSLYVFLRLLIFLAIGFSLWIKFGNKRFWKNIGLFFLFPIYPASWVFTKNAFWVIPKYLFNKNYQITLFYYIEGIIAFFVDFKYVLLKLILFILGFIVLFTFNSNWLMISIFIFGGLEILHLWKRFKETFSPIKIFRMKFDLSDESFEGQLSPEQIEKNINKGIKQDKVGKEEKIIKEMEQFLLMTEFSRTFNLKIKEVVNNRTYMLSFLGKAIFSFFLAMIYFGGINYAIFKLYPDAFKVEFEPIFFDFFYYSFFTVFPDGTDIEPTMMLSKIVRMSGVFIGVVINLLLLTVYLTISNERYKENLDRLANFTNEYSTKIDQYFKDKYGHEPAEGLNRLKNVSSTVGPAIQFFNSLLRKK